jgi:hypothetical protein
MKASTLVFAVVTAALASCSSWSVLSQRSIGVKVENNKIVVEPENAETPKNAAVKWELDSETSKCYRFEADAITFESKPSGGPSSCKSKPDPQDDFELDKMRCKSVRETQVICNRTGQPQQLACYKYTVRLSLKDFKEKEPACKTKVDPKDPWIINQ